MPLVDAKRALLGRLFDHAPLFPPASMTLPDALAEDARAQESPDAWLLGRFVVPEGVEVEGGGAAIPAVEDLAGFVRGCREAHVVFKATAGLHHAYPTDAGEHGFLNLLAACVFADEEDALRARPGAFELDGVNLLWKIDCYDRLLDGRSRDPADAVVTRRVLTILLAEEY